LFDDSGLDGAMLNFSRGLDIFGETAFVYISNHHVRELNISLQFSVCSLYHVKT
jgi:hypothetical protein